MMKGLFVWANSFCRSTFAFYEGLGKAFGVPVKIVVLKRSSGVREKTGFSNSEFSELDITFLDNVDNREKLIATYITYHHIFGTYQQGGECQRIMEMVKSTGSRYAIMSEAPCNMERGMRRVAKHLYIQYVLPRKVGTMIANADFIINLSRDDEKLLKLGWPKYKIVKCGYYPPKLIGAKVVERDEQAWKNFTIVLSGKHDWHRDPMLLLKALVDMEGKGLHYECIITQEGRLTRTMKAFAKKHHLHNVRFVGLLPIDDLRNLYERCSVFVGAGRDEPWGMRLNDALNCGAPLLISRGMGGSQLVEDYGCGMTFPRGDYKELGRILEILITNRDLYLSLASAAYRAAAQIDPFVRAEIIAKTVRERYTEWN